MFEHEVFYTMHLHTKRAAPGTINIFYNSSSLSIVSRLANVLLALVLPHVMLLGTVAFIGAILWLLLGQVLAWGAYLVLAWLTEGARLLAPVPCAAVQQPPFPLWMLLAYYGVVLEGWLWARWGKIHGCVVENA